MSDDNSSKSSSPLKMVLMVAIFVGLVLALNWVMGVAFAILKWVAIGGIALLAMWFMFRKKDSSSSET